MGIGDIEVLSRAELIALAGSPAKARALIADGIFRRVLHDAYVARDAPDDVTTRCAALHKVLPPYVLLSHWSGLRVQGLDVLPRDADRVDLLDITVPRDRQIQTRSGIRSHIAYVPDEEICEVGGLRWVTRAREAVRHLDGRSESLMESRLRVGFVLAGGPRMRTQIDLYDDNGIHCGRSDLYLDGVSVEYDGRDSRLEQVRFTGDRSRGNRISDLAVEVRRFTGSLYYQSTPAQRLAVLLSALRIASGRKRPRLRFGRDTLRPPQLWPLPTRAETDQARRTA